MRHHRRTVALVSAAAALALGLAACSSTPSGQPKNGSASTDSGKNKGNVSAAYNAANDGTVNASTKTGGTVKYGLSSTPDSFDPGNTYYAFVWNASRLWARSLTTFRPLPGKDGLELVPDLATSLGKVGDGGLTYTYTLRSGLKFSDGTPITSADVKYAVERSNYAPAVLSNGPTYFKTVLKDNAGGYKGPYEDKSGNLQSIETPNATTIVFRLAKPFADFDYLTSSPQTAPVPKAKDTGADYVKNIVSSGSYSFTSYDPNKGATLEKNPNWSASNDKIRKQYADKITVAFNQEQSGIDQDLIAGNLTQDIGGAGTDAATQPDIVNDPARKANADDALNGALAYMAISTKVAPFNNIDCRKAVQYAIDKVSAQNSYGGPLRGEIASTVMPPTVAGYEKAETYATPKNAGDATKAKSALKACGQPNGFTTNLSARGDRPNEVAMAVSIQASLKKVGITANIRKYQSGKYFSDYAGSPAFVKSNKLGLMMMAWAADWPSGYGFLDQIVDGVAIKASGNSNLSELNDPTINKQLADAIQNTDEQERLSTWAKVDKAVMEQAVIVPMLYRKALLYRPPAATNITVSAAYGMYDYLNIGTK